MTSALSIFFVPVENAALVIRYINLMELIFSGQPGNIMLKS
jgi:hypothetical protein